MGGMIIARGGLCPWTASRHAAALHQAALKPAILADFAKLPELLKQARAALGKSAPQAKKEEPKEEDPKQLSLF